MDIKISFIVAIYNVAQYLPTCLASLATFSSPFIEIILINDGSTDDSLRICKQYCHTHTNMHLITQENKGVSAVRNLGIQKARGEWICFIDGDDYMIENTDTILLNLLDSYYDIIFFGYKKVPTASFPTNQTEFVGKKILTSADMELIRIGILNCDFKKGLSYRYSNIEYCTPWGKLYKKSFLNTYNLTFTDGVKRGQDSLFNFQAYQHVKYALLVSSLCYCYRIQENSISQKYNAYIANYNYLLTEEMKNSISNFDSKFFLNNFYLFALRQYLYTLKLDCFHPDNHKPYKAKKRFALTLKSYPLYKLAFQHGILQDLRFTIRIPAFLCKYNCFFAVKILFNFRNLLSQIKIFISKS